MALDAQQQADVLFYLGWPGTTNLVGNTNYNKIVVDRMTQTTPEVDARVVLLLDEIAAVRTKLTGSTGRALVKRVGDIELNTGEAVLLKSDYKRLLRDLSSLLDIEILGSGSGMCIGLCV